MKTICLVMIVKNETKVLKRCFDSVYQYLDYWVICDTGSTDGTQDFITNYFKEKKIPGKLLHHEWKNFGHNRTLAVKAAKKTADYLLLMDADFIFKIKDPLFKKKNLDKTSYSIKYEGTLDYRQTLFVSGKKSWKYVGVTHEYIMCEGPNITSGKLDAFTFDHLADGGNRSDKFERDIRLLTEGLTDKKSEYYEPENIRYMFYLARSHKDLGHWDEAIKYYEQRAKKGGWGEEVYICLFDMGVCMMKRGDPYDKFKGVLHKAYLTRPTRLEALYTLVKYCHQHELYMDGYKYGYPALNNVYPSGDMLFIDKEVHEWKFFHEVAMCAYYIDKPFESLKIYNKHTLPENQKSNIQMFKEKYELQIRSTQKQPLKGNYDVTVILNVYKRINLFEKQLLSIINQTVKPKEIWVCIFASPHENDFLTILSKYPDVKVIRSDINFKFYGRFQMALQVTTPYVCFYDDDRLPRENNIKFYMELIQKPEFEKAILGQWGWMLHAPKDENTEWEFHPHYRDSWWIKHDITREGRAFKVDYLCGHWFMHRDILSVLFKEGNIDFSTGEDIRLSFLAYKHFGIESYCCYPLSGSELIEHNEGNVRGSTDDANLRVRSKMIKHHIEDNYRLVINRQTTVVNLYRTNKNICFFCPDYTSLGGSELTMKHLYQTFCKMFPDDRIKITTNGQEMLAFKPDIVITQQHSIKFTMENASGYGYDVYIILHGPGQFRDYHPRCKLLIYNSYNLLKDEESFVNDSIPKIVLHPTIDSQQVVPETETNEERKKITFIGSSSYNIIKGSDLFVELAKATHDQEFLHVSKYKPINYQKDKYFGMEIIPPSTYVAQSANELPKNLEIIEQTNEINKVYQKTKILIVPSIVESFGRVAVEAAMNGIPVIASDLPGLREATFNLAYYVKDYRNVDEFKQALSEVESNYSFYQEKTREIVRLYNEKQDGSIQSLRDFISNTEEDYFYEEYLNSDPSISEILLPDIDIFDSKVGVIVPIYNRPEYLTLTLESLAESELENTIIVLIDDNSNEETTQIVRDFSIEEVPIIKIFKKENKNMYHSLKIGWYLLKKLGCKYICNIDSDVLVTSDWLLLLETTYEKSEKKPLLTGFNTTSNNHTNISETDSYYEKLTVGGVNLFFDSCYVDEFSKLLTDRMWDYNLSHYCRKNRIPLLCTKPSVIQHIGYYGLNANKNNFDYAYDFQQEVEFDNVKYLYYPGLDSPNGDIEMMLTADIEEMAKICNENPKAVAFNSNGWLKSHVKPTLRDWDVYDVTKFKGTWVKIVPSDNQN